MDRPARRLCRRRRTPRRCRVPGKLHELHRVGNTTRNTLLSSRCHPEPGRTCPPMALGPSTLAARRHRALDRRGNQPRTTTSKANDLWSRPKNAMLARQPFAETGRGSRRTATYSRVSMTGSLCKQSCRLLRPGTPEADPRRRVEAPRPFPTSDEPYVFPPEKSELPQELDFKWST